MSIFKNDPVTGEIIVFGTSRTKLRELYKNEYPFNSLDRMFNLCAPEIAGKQIISSNACKKILAEMGLGSARLELKEVY